MNRFVSLAYSPAIFMRFVSGIEPTGRQLEFFSQQGRWRCRRCGRRFGKSALTLAEVLWQMARRPNIRALVVGPSLDQARIYFDYMRAWARGGNLGMFISSDRTSPYNEIMLKNGSMITARSTREGGQAVRGRGYDIIVLTEAAYIDNEAVEAGIMPTTLEAMGPVVYAEGTPWSTTSWFYRMCQQYGEVHATVYDAPHIPPENIKALENETDPYYWRVEYMAEWVDDTASVFPYISLSRCLDDYIPHGQPEPGRKYAMGVDLAKAQDYTAIMVVDITQKPYRIAAWEHYQGRPYIEVAEDVNRMATMFSCRPVVDATGVGEAVVEQILACKPVKFTAQVKEQVISALRAAVERAEIKIPVSRMVPLAEEMKLFRQEVRATGMKMSSPMGKHDDCVIALALAIWSTRETSQAAYWAMREHMEDIWADE